MRALTVVDYENTSHFDGDDINQVMDACRSNILALLKLKNNKRIQIEGVDVTFIARTSRVVPKIGLDDDFWLAVALGTLDK